MSTALRESKCNFFANMVAEAAGDSKRLWKAYNSVLQRTPVSVLPYRPSLLALAEEFNVFFLSKVDNIRQTVTMNVNPCAIPALLPPPSSSTATLSFFAPASVSEIRLIMQTSPPKSMPTDPIPCWLIRKCLDILCFPLTSMVNKIIHEGMPLQFKLAYVTPLLKHRNLDADDLSNYRPVSQLPILFNSQRRL